ncbi:MAG: hypothetical protein RL417_1051 [Pseudomonadota bacterium]|jgi:glycosyltransferase involved in cell wall biosynthesis
MSAPIHQFVHTLSYGDAISGEVLALERCFRAAGRESEIFALNVHPKYKGRARTIAEFPAEFKGEVVLHYSLGSSLNGVYAGLGNATRTLIYHNLTPARWFEGVNPRIVDDINAGLAELPRLCAVTDRLIADSTFNAGELKALGFDAQVLELPIDAAKWSIPKNETIARLIGGEPGLHLLHVGRLAPNKCIEDIIRTFWFIRRFIEPESRLWLVGIDIDTELYAYTLKRLVHDLELGDAVTFAGCLTDDEVRALYEGATAYLCMSEHEGFCLPLIEAMYFGLPVAAFGASAVPDTVADGGIVFYEKRHAAIAEMIGEIYRNGELRQKLAAAGCARVQALSFERFEKRVGALFGDTTRARSAVGG